MKRSQLILIAVILGVLAIGGGVYVWFTSRVGVVVVDVSSAPKDLTIKLSDGSVKPTKLGNSYTYRVPEGNYQLQVSATGYKEFSTRLQVNVGDDYRVAVNLEFLHDPTITSPSQIAGLGADATISDVTYYRGQLWAVATLRLNGSDPAFAALQYDPVKAIWIIRAGPGTYFDVESLAGVPQDVMTDLKGRGA